MDHTVLERFIPLNRFAEEQATEGRLVHILPMAEGIALQIFLGRHNLLLWSVCCKENGISRFPFVDL